VVRNGIRSHFAAKAPCYWLPQCVIAKFYSIMRVGEPSGEGFAAAEAMCECVYLLIEEN